MTASTSVIMPVRNGATHITEAIASVLDQLDRQDELIVVDDGSTDNTRSIIAAIVDSRMRVLSNPRRGVSAARNAGLAAARGEFIAFLDHDDIWPAGRHKVMVRALTENPAVDAVFGRIRIQFDSGSIASTKYQEMDGKFPSDGLTSTNLYRRRILERIDGFAEDMRFGEDVDYNLRLAEAGMRSMLCEIDAVVYRRHASNLTNDLQASRDGFFDILRRKAARVRQHTASRP
jgi:glycosyltransferase involved in cell wall biosynthesis